MVIQHIENKRTIDYFSTFSQCGSSVRKTARFVTIPAGLIRRIRHFWDEWRDDRSLLLFEAQAMFR
jgi:hypothetical protein